MKGFPFQTRIDSSRSEPKELYCVLLLLSSLCVQSGIVRKPLQAAPSKTIQSGSDGTSQEQGPSAATTPESTPRLLTPAKYSDGKWGYKDESGAYRIPPQLDTATKFSEGLAAVALHKKVGYIDLTGTMVISPRFVHGEPFREGLALVYTTWGMNVFGPSFRFLLVLLSTSYACAQDPKGGLLLPAETAVLVRTEENLSGDTVYEGQQVQLVARGLVQNDREIVWRHKGAWFSELCRGVGNRSAFISLFAQMLLAACRSRSAFSMSSNRSCKSLRCGIVFPECLRYRLNPGELPMTYPENMVGVCWRSPWAPMIGQTPIQSRFTSGAS